MTRVLVIPAAGSGTRLKSATPKALHPILGRPMLAHLLDRYRAIADRVVLVVSPTNANAIRAFTSTLDVDATFAVQETPTGMLDAILLGLEPARLLEPDHVWITWCDQIGISEDTVQRLAALSDKNPDAAVVMPTATMERPYIHLERADSGRITAVRHRREGDVMPDVGESDIGLFSLSHRAAFEFMPEYSARAVPGGSTRERNFLPFIPWVAPQADVITFPASHPMEAVGINDADDVARIEEHLRHA